ncbi:hypothetical protein EUTSA_v10019469mg [Eutrema salsugineum]|uniref:TTF-type domain-containing protein n=1 Tax=Eutrema salsugineum TaxID=72664 RepID=V4KMX6_EUTSA|nr:hypothetical protein EUTSA_v10019469mg [Eutrema salsugineum]
MEKFLKRRSPPSNIELDDLSHDPAKRKNIQESNTMEQFLKRRSPPSNIELDDLPHDLAKQKNIQDYHPDQRDESIGNALRRFNPHWFDQYPDWLEYSMSEEKAFCLFCYLFRVQVGKQSGCDAFVSTGFSSWNKADSFSKLVCDHTSFHSNAKNKCEDLMRQGQSIRHALHKQNDIMKDEYWIRLSASIDVSRHLLHQGLSFRAHNEKEVSTNKGNFIELLKYTASQNEAVRKVVRSNAPKNNQMTSPPIQKYIAHCFAEEQMAVVFRFVDKFGLVKERFIGISHMKETSSLTLKHAIDSLFVKNGLSLKKVRGQGYDGAINMKGEFNGLRSLILKESRSAYYVHCFAHQLQKVVLTESNRKRMDEGIKNGEIKSGTGLNQDRSLENPGNTRWGSHYKTLLRLVEMFPCIVESTKRQQAYSLLKYFHTFDFVFYLQMMLVVLGLTNNLLKALQKGDQEILNAVSLVESTKRQLQKLRDDGWDGFVAKVYSFSDKNETELTNVEDEFVDSRKPRTKTGITNLHHYKVDCFYTVLDMQLQEFNDRFDEMNSKLLVCMASLSPIDSFRQFDKSKLVRLAELYPDDFSFVERRSLDHQLDIYLDNVQKDDRFTNIVSLGDLARVLVETRKHLSHPLVYRLLKLCLILSVAIATVESDCLVCFIEKHVVETITNETVIKRFQNMSERKVYL